MRKLVVAGVGSVLPAASMARTAKVCAPPPSEAVCGLVHGVNAPLSMLHRNVESDSVDVKLNDGLPFVLAAGGPAVMVVFGATVSTVNVRLAALASVLPAREHDDPETQSAGRANWARVEAKVQN